MSDRAALLFLVLSACTLGPKGPGDSATTGGGSTSSASASSDLTTTTTTTTTGTLTTGTAASGSAGTGGPDATSSPPADLPDPGAACDTFQQNCPEGQKCMPYSEDGLSSWNSTKCVPIVPDPDGAYGPCTLVGAELSGEDTCDEGLMCWNVDPDTGIGVCWGLCTGSIQDPMCADALAYCLIGRTALALCVPNCNPLAQMCGTSSVCIPNQGDPNTFMCSPDASGAGGQALDPCQVPNGCDPGLLCADNTVADECDPMAGPGCCVPFCDVSKPNTCPGKGQQCLPWFGMGMAPPGFETLGSCGLP